ncbi:MAG: hypothetical protein H0T60_12540 [Acidobacteria bacterium]|nr:hypothetical protein [Acidobacteriota bacterium]
MVERETGDTEITGGTDKTGKGGLADSGAPSTGSTGVEETGDIMGATSTHAGAGGVMDNTGGVGTAPTGDTFFGDDES